MSQPQVIVQQFDRGLVQIWVQAERELIKFHEGCFLGAPIWVDLLNLVGIESIILRVKDEQ